MSAGDEDPFQNLFNGLVTPSPIKNRTSSNRQTSPSLMSDFAEEAEDEPLDVNPNSRTNENGVEHSPVEAPPPVAEEAQSLSPASSSSLPPADGQETSSPDDLLVKDSSAGSEEDHPTFSLEKEESTHKPSFQQTLPDKENSNSNAFLQYLDLHAEEENSRPTTAAVPPLPPVHVEEEELSDEETPTSSSSSELGKVDMTTLVVEPHCKASEGGDCYRHGAGFFCTYCAYTVCEACYAAIQHKRKEPRRITGVTPTRDGALQHGEGELVTQCHLCRRGHLHQEDNMLFPWCCEGPYPASRVSRGGNAAYDTNSLQRYHTMKSQYSRRAASTAPLRASFHGIQEEEGEVRVVTDYRPACCPEGGRFLFSVDNPRLRETLVWAALSVDRRHAQPSVGLTTTIPLQVMRCPPTIRDLPPRRYVLSVPSGYYGTHGVHALMLFYRSDLFLRAEMQLSAVGGLSGHPSLPAIKPLLVVRLLHRLPIPRPVSKRAREDEATETSRKDVDCPELALCLDYLQHGKSVAVYGALSKYFFLEHVAHSTALLDYRVCVVDCSLGSVLRRERDVNNNSITSSGRGLSPCAKALEELHQVLKAEEEVASRQAWSERDFAAHAVLTKEQQQQFEVMFYKTGRSASPRRRSEGVIVVEEEEPMGKGSRCSPVVEEERSHPSAPSPPPSGVPASVGEEGDTAVRDYIMTPFSLPSRNGKENELLFGMNFTALSFTKKEEEEKDGGDDDNKSNEEGNTLPSDGVTLYTAKAPHVTCSDESVRLKLQQQLRRPMKCVQWLAPPHDPSPKVTAARAAIARPTVLVVHNIDFMDADGEARLLSLLRLYPLQLRLLTSVDKPQWSTTNTALSMDLVYVHLTHLLRPRVYEMRYYHAMQLLTEYEATSHGAGARPARGGGTLPMHDTVKRVLYSLPTAFADLVRVLVEAQEEAGEGRYVSMFLLVEHMEKKGIMISQGRLKALQRELTSNRLAVYDPAEHALCIPQHTKLRRILQEVAEERSTGLPGNLQQV